MNDQSHKFCVYATLRATDTLHHTSQTFAALWNELCCALQADFPEAAVRQADGAAHEARGYTRRVEVPLAKLQGKALGLQTYFTH